MKRLKTVLKQWKVDKDPVVDTLLKFQSRQNTTEDTIHERFFSNEEDVKF